MPQPEQEPHPEQEATRKHGQPGVSGSFLMSRVYCTSCAEEEIERFWSYFWETVSCNWQMAEPKIGSPVRLLPGRHSDTWGTAPRSCPPENSPEGKVQTQEGSRPQETSLLWSERQDCLVTNKASVRTRSGLPWWLSGKEFACQCRRCRFDPWVRRCPGEGMATHSSILAWKIPWIEEPGGLLSMRLQRHQTCCCCC